MAHQPFGGFDNDNGLGQLGDLNGLAGDGEESDDDDDREDEIKQLLADAFSNETFDDGSEHSFTSDHSKKNGQGSVESSIHSYNGNSDLSNGGGTKNGFSFLNNGHTTVIPNQNRQEPTRPPHQFTNGRITASNNGLANTFATNPPQQIRSTRAVDRCGGGDQRDCGSEEMEEKNNTVSIIHKKHCPQLANDESNGSDGNGNWTSTPVNKMEQLQTLNNYRERQIARSEETIAGLTKDKRALNHQVGLMRTEMIQMKVSYEDVEKALKLKEEEVNFLKSKIQEAIIDYEALRRGERELKDENNRLVSQIGRLEQEVTLLSTIGSSAQHAEVDTVVRQIRDRHAQEIVSYKTEISNLESELRSYKRLYNTEQKQPTETTATQTLPNQAHVSTQSILFGGGSATSTRDAEVDNIVRQIKDRHAQEISTYKAENDHMESELRSYKERLYVEQKQLTDTSAQTLSYTGESSTQTQQYQAQSQCSTQTEEVKDSSTSINCSTAEVQTDETLKTYELLGGLIEQWANEVSESAKRTELAESQVYFTELSLRKLSNKFKSLYKMTSLCRQEWKKQEEFLKKRNEDTKAHYLNVLIRVQSKFNELE